MQTSHNPFTPAPLTNSPNLFDPATTAQLIQAHNAAGSNFYSIALFSLINSIINFFDGGLYFPIGLGITQIIDGFSLAFRQELPEYDGIILIIGLVLNILIVAIVAFFGFFIKKQNTWLIVVAAGFYLLDGLLLLLFKDWIGVGFHAYFLFRVWTSWQAIRNLSKPTLISNTSPSI